MPRLRPAPEAEPPKEPGLFESKLDTDSVQLTDTVSIEYVDKSKGELLPKDGPVVVDKTPEPDEATLALQKQITDLKKSEELQREFGRRMAQEREEAHREAAQYKKANQENEEAANLNAIGAMKAEADKAESDYINALNAGDNSAAAEAQRRLARAEARIDRLELEKEEIEQRKKEPPKVEAARPAPPTGDPIDGFNLPNGEKDWLRAHRDYLTDARKISALRYADEQASLAGLRPGNPGYLPYIEDTLRTVGSLPKVEEIEDEPTPPRETDRSAAIVSAPVSREAPTSNGQRQSSKIKLSAEEQEYARIAGITDVEYAKQKQKLNQHKMNGDYGERR